MNRLTAVLAILFLVGCGQGYNEFIEADIKVINTAIQTELDNELCDKIEYDKEQKGIWLWCPKASKGHFMIGSRIKADILEGIEDKSIQIHLFFEEYNSDEYDVFTIKRG